jgi:predicted membrane channel-forming protein YqfA (hemolysin III family)
MQEKKEFRIHSFILFVIIAVSGVYLVYLQMSGSDDLTLKLLSLAVFIGSWFFATKNWVKDNPEKNKKNWSDIDKQN